MALEIPNVVAAAGVALVALVAIEGAGPVTRTYGVELVSSSNLAGVEFLDNQTVDDDSFPAELLWTLHNPVNPEQASWSIHGMFAFGLGITPGPVPTPTGVPELDDLELGQVLATMDGTVADPDTVGSASVVWLNCWETPLSGEVA